MSDRGESGDPLGLGVCLRRRSLNKAVKYIHLSLHWCFLGVTIIITPQFLNGLMNNVDSLELKIDGQLLGGIRRQQMAMQELMALASRYHRNDP